MLPTIFIIIKCQAKFSLISIYLIQRTFMHRYCSIFNFLASRQNFAYVTENLEKELIQAQGNTDKKSFIYL